MITVFNSFSGKLLMSISLSFLFAFFFFLFLHLGQILLFSHFVLTFRVCFDELDKTAISPDLKGVALSMSNLCVDCVLGVFGRLAGARASACGAWGTLGNWLAGLEQAQCGRPRVCGCGDALNVCLELEWAWVGCPMAY